MSKPTKPLVISIDDVEIGRITPVELPHQHISDTYSLPVGSRVRLIVENSDGTILLESEGVIEAEQS